VIGYSSVAEIKNVTFGLGNQKEALEIATGKSKDAIQTMEGSFVPTTPAEALKKHGLHLNRATMCRLVLTQHAMRISLTGPTLSL
jgi:hypothetical protein